MGRNPSVYLRIKTKRAYKVLPNRKNQTKLIAFLTKNKLQKHITEFNIQDILQKLPDIQRNVKIVPSLKRDYNQWRLTPRSYFSHLELADTDIITMRHVKKNILITNVKIGNPNRK